MPSAIADGIVRVDQHRCVAGDLGQRRQVRRDDRRAAGHRLERRQAEPFVERREDEHARQPIHHRQRFLRQVAQEADVLVELMMVDRTPQRRVLRDVVADQHELQVIQAAAAHQLERFDQPLEVLVRLDVAGVEHELVVELIALADADDVLLAGLDREPLVVGVVDHVDLARPECRRTAGCRASSSPRRSAPASRAATARLIDVRA